MSSNKTGKVDASCNVFVYGTLLFDEVVWSLTGKIFASDEATLNDYRRCRIIDLSRDAKGPAIILAPGYSVKGRILYTVDPVTLHILDLFELAATGYERVSGQVLSSDGTNVDVVFYRATEAIKQFLSDDDWSASEFREAYLPDYVNKRIPALRLKWQQNGEI